MAQLPLVLIYHGYYSPPFGKLRHLLSPQCNSVLGIYKRLGLDFWDKIYDVNWIRFQAVYLNKNLMIRKVQLHLGWLSSSTSNFWSFTQFDTKNCEKNTAYIFGVFFSPKRIRGHFGIYKHTTQFGFDKWESLKKCWKVWPDKLLTFLFFEHLLAWRWDSWWW